MFVQLQHSGNLLVNGLFSKIQVESDFPSSEILWIQISKQQIRIRHRGLTTPQTVRCRTRLGPRTSGTDPNPIHGINPGDGTSSCTNFNQFDHRHP